MRQLIQLDSIDLDSIERYTFENQYVTLWGLRARDKQGHLVEIQGTASSWAKLGLVLAALKLEADSE
jgi:hypothetical protein